MQAGKKLCFWGMGMEITNADEWLFYGGMALFVLSLLLLIICILFFMIHRKKLNRCLDEDYGPKLGRDGYPDVGVGKRQVGDS